MSSDLKKFISFYEENKKKLDMPNDINYPLNYKKGYKWAMSQCDEESRDFAISIIKNTDYISFLDFTKRIKVICDAWADDAKKKENKNNVNVMILPFTLSKSNIWVSMLCFKYIRKYIHEIEYNVTEVYNNTKIFTSKYYKKKVRCIICDDCSYTAQQILSISKFDYTLVDTLHNTKPPDDNDIKWLNWNRNNIIEAKKMINNIDTNDFSVDLLIPYLSNIAENAISKYRYIRLPRSRLIFTTFANNIDIDNIPIHILNEFRDTFQYHNDVSAIYFDHKIADSVSTFNKIYTLSPLFNCTSPMDHIRMGFIDNCDKETKISNDINIYNLYLDIEKDTNHKVCPPSFYKNINYTQNNKPAQQDILISTLLKSI
jgi:hypothetical protein